MTDEQIIIEVAKLDGWIVKEEWISKNFEDPIRTFELCYVELALGDYLTSRDAIIPVIEKHITNPKIEKVFNYALYDLLPKEVSEVNAMTYVMAVKATPKQLCIALLKATGKWKE